MFVLINYFPRIDLVKRCEAYKGPSDQSTSSKLNMSTTFQNLGLTLSIITFHSKLVTIVSFATGQQQGGVRALGT